MVERHDPNARLNPDTVPLVDDLDLWYQRIAEADRLNILNHCRICGYEWVTSQAAKLCDCGSRQIESICCWQFPDG